MNLSVDLGLAGQAHSCSDGDSNTAVYYYFRNVETEAIEIKRNLNEQQAFTNVQLSYVKKILIFARKNYRNDVQNSNKN